ncbi:hypothetical protein NC652_020635 [Populus alba x Populus x berolinensis]|nr:hypothetical protein NC652_020635 [Populus alba x Populus x berolinensis]
MHLIFDMWTDRRTQAICANLIQIAIKDLCAAIKREMEKIINPGIHSGFPYLGISIFQGSSIRVAVIRQLNSETV